jgi:hypothetical protein
MRTTSRETEVQAAVEIRTWVEAEELLGRGMQVALAGVVNRVPVARVAAAQEPLAMAAMTVAAALAARGLRRPLQGHP